MKAFNNPRTIFQQKINSILRTEKTDENVFETIFKLFLVSQYESTSKTKEDPDTWKVLLELYSKLGSPEFASLLDIIGGKTIRFPTSEEFEESILTVLCYYYKEILGLEWDKIKDKLASPKLNSMKYGIKARQLKAFIDLKTLSQLKTDNTN